MLKTCLYASAVQGRGGRGVCVLDRARLRGAATGWRAGKTDAAGAVAATLNGEIRAFMHNEVTPQHGAVFAVHLCTSPHSHSYFLTHCLGSLTSPTDINTIPYRDLHRDVRRAQHMHAQPLLPPTPKPFSNSNIKRALEMQLRQSPLGERIQGVLDCVSVHLTTLSHTREVLTAFPTSGSHIPPVWKGSSSPDGRQACVLKNEPSSYGLK